jgi:hypothetical protein
VIREVVVIEELKNPNGKRPVEQHSEGSNSK